jgi:hypothetical protein
MIKSKHTISKLHSTFCGNISKIGVAIKNYVNNKPLCFDIRQKINVAVQSMYSRGPLMNTA